jgi:hypothetical protein
VAKARGTDALQGIVVESWVSATGHSEIHSFSSPYPGNIQHHISVDSNAGYPIDFYVYGQIVSGYPHVAYTAPRSAKWDSPIAKVIGHGEVTHPMQVSAVAAPARIQVPLVEFDTFWSGRMAANLNPPAPEISVDVS